MSTTDIPITDPDSTQPPPESPDPPSALESAAGPRHPLHALAMRLHFYAGLFVAPFILVAALTGAVYATAPTLESIVDRGLLHVDSTGPAKPLADQVGAAVAQQPNLALNAVSPAQHSGDTTRVMFTDPTLGESERRAVFIDPASSRPVGTSVVYGSADALPTRTWIDQLHRNLHLGQTGRLYSELAASWLWIIALAGLVVWVRRMRSRGSVRRLAWPGRSRPGRHTTMNRHAAVGFWVLVPVLFLSATGMTWSTHAGAHVDQLRAQLSWSAPTVSTALPGAAAPDPAAGGEHAAHGGGHHMGMSPSADTAAQLERVYAVTREHGVDGPLEITVPPTDGAAYVAQERRISGSYTQDSVAVDGRTGTITDERRFADWPLMAKLANWGIQLHMGLLFGLANQLLLLATMIALLTVIARGYLMWWRRRPTSVASRFASGPRRGTVRRMPAYLAVPVIAVVAVVGWFAPLMGISLLAFLTVDVIVGRTRRNRDRLVRG